MAGDLPQVLLDDRKTKTENRRLCQVRTQLTNTTLEKPRRRKGKKGTWQETMAY